MRILLVMIMLGEGSSPDALAKALLALAKDSINPSPSTFLIVSERPVATLTRLLERYLADADQMVIMDVHDAPVTGFMTQATWKWLQYWKAA